MTDTYSVIAAAIGSLKGPRHGGANIKVVQMFDDMMEQISDWTDEEEVGNHLRKLLHKEAFDKAGLIYGVGHAIYSKSDPRAEIFRSFVEKLSEEKGCKKEFALYSPGGTAGSPNHRAGTPDVQRCQHQRGLLFRFRLQNAEPAHRTVYPHLRDRKNRRLERTQTGRTGNQWQDYASCL